MGVSGKMTNFIQALHLKKGGLKKELGIPFTKKVPKTVLNKIVHTDIGNTIPNPTHLGHKKIKVTRLLDERANLALTLRELEKRRQY